MTDELSISPYTYKSGYTCYALHTGAKPTKDNILFEATRLETVKGIKEVLEKDKK